MIKKKAYAKVNIFLKIVGKRDNYHLLASRFARVKNLYDIVEFKKGVFDTFTLEGDFGCETKVNTIYKAYLQLSKISNEVKKYFTTHKVVVTKNIPEFAGLGGGSSDCATFILMVNDVCNLNLTKDELSNIGAKIGADVPFFIYEYDSANVSGVGEIVEPFYEDELNIQTITPKIKCDTKNIFTTFRNEFYKEVSQNEVEKLLKMKSIDIFNNLSIQEVNDLYLPAVKCEPKLIVQYKNFKTKHYFSGSGSSFFYLI